MQILRSLLFLPLLVTAVGELSAQRTTLYPQILYRGENVLTFTRAGGIEKIEVATSRYIIAERTTGFLTDCPDTVSIDVIARSVTTNETLSATVYGCDGSSTEFNITTENWTIRPEFTGQVELGQDSCLQCEIITSNPRFLDSITVTHPDLTVETDSTRVRSGDFNGYTVTGVYPFKYRVCYQPTRVGFGTDTILLHFRRSSPNGGYASYTIAKPITWQGMEPEVEEEPEVSRYDPDRPIDPTAFRNVLIPSATTQKEGGWFYGNYALAGHLFGYVPTDRLTLFAGGSYVPDFIARFRLGTIGAKYELVRDEKLSVAAGLQVALSSVTDSEIRTIAPYGIASYGTDRSRVTVALGYGFKRHTIPTEVFDRNAFVIGIGAGTEIAEGWKMNGELASIESSGILPFLITARKFGEKYAIDFGLGINLGGDADVSFNSLLSGEANSLGIIPYLSGMWTF